MNQPFHICLFESALYQNDLSKEAKFHIKFAPLSTYTGNHENFSNLRLRSDITKYPACDCYVSNKTGKAYLWHKLAADWSVCTDLLAVEATDTELKFDELFYPVRFADLQPQRSMIITTDNCTHYRNNTNNRIYSMNKSTSVWKIQELDVQLDFLFEDVAPNLEQEQEHEHEQEHDGLSWGQWLKSFFVKKKSPLHVSAVGVEPTPSIEE